jgi:sulfonate transport system ATP-binding protein
MIALKEDGPSTKRAAPRTAAVELEGVGKRFGDKLVLNRINLEIPNGELVAIVGRSGCGKSTLLRLAVGLESPSEGSIRIGGVQLSGPNHQVRLMFQDAALLPWQTVLNNVALAVPPNRDRVAEALRALALVGLERRAKDWPGILSGGQRQRVALARALASKASVLLLDEPLGALDALTRLEMQTLIEKVWMHERFTAVLVTHDVEEAVALADRVLVMEEGEIIAETQTTLPRPRNRTSLEFINLKEKLLGWVINGIADRERGIRDTQKGI